MHRYGCILSKFYIKPQLTYSAMCNEVVVSYRNSTSNHNLSSVRSASPGVVSYRNSTSNHNGKPRRSTPGALYLIEILHQTTTLPAIKPLTLALYLIEILHQTTTCAIDCIVRRSCILSKFYIKPQPYAQRANVPTVVSYRNSTSNHNYMGCPAQTANVVSYRNSTSNHNDRRG